MTIQEHPPRTTEKISVVVKKAPLVVMLLCAATLIFEGYDIYVFGAVVPDLITTWHTDLVMIGFIGSASVFGMLGGAILAGLLTDVLGRRKIFLAAVVTFSIGMLLCALAPSPEALLGARIIVGLGTGGFMPNVLATVVEYSPANRRNFNVSLALVGVGIGGVLSALLAIWVLPVFGFRFMFAFGIISLIVIVPLTYFKMPESISWLVSQGRVDDAREIIRRRQMDIALELSTVEVADEAQQSTRRGAIVLSLFSRRYLAATLVFWFGTAFCMVLIFGANAWLPTLMMNAGYGLQSSLTFLVALNVGAVVGSLLAAHFADKVGPRRFILIGFGCSTVALIALAFQPPTLLVYVFVLLVGFGAAGTQNLINAYMAIYYPAFNRGTGVGFALGFGRIGGIIGPIYGGLLLASGIGVTASFFAFVIPAVLALVIMAFGPKVRPHTDAVTAVR